MNIYHQIRGFYSKVFNQEHDLRSTHISLYMFLLNQNNRSNWSEWFKCPHDTAMMGALINSKTTYYKCLNDLKSFGFIDYQKGINDFKSPKIKIIDLSKEQDIVPKPESSESKIDTLCRNLFGNLPEQVAVLLLRNLSVLLSGNKDILLTGNYKLVTINSDDEVIDGEKTLKRKSFFAADVNLDEKQYRLFLYNCIKEKQSSRDVLFMQQKIDLSLRNNLWNDFIKNSIQEVPQIEDDKHAWNTFKKFVKDNAERYQKKLNRNPQ